jgi:hypothetical protein
MKRYRLIYFLPLAVAIVLSASAGFDWSTTVIAALQKSSKEQHAVNLSQGAKVNGYRVVDEGDGSFRFEGENVIDPVTGKKLEGEHRLEWKCKENGLPLLRNIRFSSGRASKVQRECLILITPRILIREDEE